MMDGMTCTLRVTAPDPEMAHVSARRQQCFVGRPIELDEASPRIAALEYALGAIAGEVTDDAMRACGGAAFGGAHGIDRLFRDARAPIVMAPTSDQAYEFIGRALCGLEVF